MRTKLYALLVLLLLAAHTPAQTTFATITGSATDGTGALVPGVTVTATHNATGIVTTAASNDEGVYTIAQLREGTYTVRASKTGFSEFVVEAVTLLGRDVRRIDIPLQVGSVDTVIEVTGGATLIETETARISDTRDVAQLRDMPLNSRAIWAQLSLVPNVLQASTGSTIRFAGSRTNQSHWSIDGTTMSDGVTRNADRAAGELRRVVSGDPHRFRQQHGGVRDDRPGHDGHQERAPTPFMAAYSTTTARRGSARAILSLRRGQQAFRICPAEAPAAPSIIPKVYDGRNKTFVFGSFETFQGSVTTRSLQSDGAAGGLAFGRFLRAVDAGARSADRPAVSRTTGSRPSRLNRDVARAPEPLLPAAKFRRTRRCCRTRTIGENLSLTADEAGLLHDPWRPQVHATRIR